VGISIGAESGDGSIHGREGPPRGERRIRVRAWQSLVSVVEAVQVRTMRAGIAEFHDSFSGQLVFEPKVPLLHHRSSYVAIDRIELRVIGIRKRVGGKALCPEIGNHLAGVSRLETNGTVAWIGWVGIGRNRATARRIETLAQEVWRIEAGAGEGERPALLPTIEDAVSTTQDQRISDFVGKSDARGEGLVVGIDQTGRARSLDRQERSDSRC